MAKKKLSRAEKQKKKKEYNRKKRERKTIGSLGLSLDDFLKNMIPSIHPRVDSKEEQRLKAVLKDKDPFLGAATIAALCMNPKLQSNQLRLEKLIAHFILEGKGRTHLNKECTKDCFEIAGSIYGHLEDPAEDVFVSQVYSHNENFKIFEGLWEGSAFYLQRFIDIVVSMPNQGHFDFIKKSIFALLKISNLLVDRVSLDSYIIGEEYPRKTIPEAIFDDFDDKCNMVRFSRNDLDVYEIDSRHLAPFLLDTSSFTANIDMMEQKIWRYPIVLLNGEYFIISPASICTAIRQFLIEETERMGQLELLEKNLANSYAIHFYKTHLLGKLSNVPVIFRKEDKAKHQIAELMTNIDDGRPLLVYFIQDDFDDKENGWINGFNSGENLGKYLSSKIEKDTLELSKAPDFREGLCLIVVCGWGRGLSLPIFHKPKGWMLEHTSAYDLTTLSDFPEVTPLILWRLLKGKELLEKEGVELMNIGGLLNMFGYSEALNGHLLPHDQMIAMKKGFLNLSISPNHVLPIRVKALKAYDGQVAITPEGEGILIRKKENSCFIKEDERKPLYASVTHAIEKILKAVYKTHSRNWWCTFESVNDLDTEKKMHSAYQIWDAASNWLDKIAPVIEKRIGCKLNAIGDINWIISFYIKEKTKVNVIEYSKLEKHYKVTIKNPSTIECHFSKDFEYGFYGSSNSGERELVKSLVTGIFKLFNEKPCASEIEDILDEIMPDKSEKYIHLFEAAEYIDYMSPYLPEPILIDKIDDANNRIGLDAIGDVKLIEGVDECTKYLNSLVPRVWKNIQGILESLDREKLITQLLINLSAIQAKKLNWNRTIKSFYALHSNSDEAKQVASERISQFDGSLLGSRLVIEMAICQCPVEGIEPGILEISKLMSYSNLLHYIGGWSNAIKNGVLLPKIQVSAYGEILIDNSFIENIIAKYGNKTQRKLLDQQANQYDDLFKEKIYIKNAEERFEKDFVTAWNKEFGFAIDEARYFIDMFEDYGIKKQLPVFTLSLQDILGRMSKEEIPENSIINILNNLSLYPRKSWHKVPKGFIASDWEPWRFRRRLSLISRPIIKLSNDKYLFSPDLLRKCFFNLLRNCYSAEFDEQKMISHEMRSWIGKRRNEAGHAFNSKVSNELISMGWKTRSDIKLTEILSKAFDKDFGDIDVLAWNYKEKRILAIECKDLQFAKTHTEISEQVKEFRGYYRGESANKPDRLKKHLLRLDCLREHYNDLIKFIDVDEDYQLECHLVFSQIVPIGLDENPNLKNVVITFFDNLKEI
jgi:hypothetical protein